MKLIKSHLIFTSVTYRFVMILIAAIVIALCSCGRFFPPELAFTAQAMIGALLGGVVLFSDTSVFGGLHNKEGGKIACVQSSKDGDKVLLMGVLADRIFILLWITAVEIAYVFDNVYLYDNKDMVWTLSGHIFNIMSLYVVLTIIININRYIYQQYTFQLIAVFETGIAAVIIILCWFMFPINNMMLATILTSLAMIVTVLTVAHAELHIRRAYYD